MDLELFSHDDGWYNPVSLEDPVPYRRKAWIYKEHPPDTDTPYLPWCVLVSSAQLDRRTRHQHWKKSGEISTDNNI